MVSLSDLCGFTFRSVAFLPALPVLVCIAAWSRPATEYVTAVTANVVARYVVIATDASVVSVTAVSAHFVDTL